MGASLAAGCGEEESIVSYRVPKEPMPTAGVVTAGAQRDVPRWKLPEGWREVGREQNTMRYATIEVGEGPPLTLTVMALPAQNLSANLARWAQQVGMTPNDPDDLTNAVRRVQAGPFAANMADLTGPSSRILAALVDHEGMCWSFKLQGEPRRVGAEKPRFEAFVASIRFAPEGENR
ncbi:MAG: hypothetical protein ACOC1F_00010 [Myxococcota bacterium]